MLTAQRGGSLVAAPLRCGTYLERDRGFQTPAFYEPKNEYWNVPLMRNEEVIEQPADQTTLTQRYTEEAVRFIEENKDHPFFLYLPHTMPLCGAAH